MDEFTWKFTSYKQEMKSDDFSRIPPYTHTIFPSNVIEMENTIKLRTNPRSFLS